MLVLARDDSEWKALWGTEARCWITDLIWGWGEGRVK